MICLFLAFLSEGVAAHGPPRLEKHPFVMKNHGQTRIDDYYWFRDRENPLVLKHLEAENQYLRGTLNPAFQETLFQEAKSRVPAVNESAPVFDEGFYYFSRQGVGQQYTAYLRKKASLNAPEELLFDENLLAEGRPFLECEEPEVSPDQNLILTACDFVGRKFFTITGKDLRSGQDLGFEIKNVASDLEWSNDNRFFFYVKQDSQTLREREVHRFDLLTQEDILLYDEKDEAYTVGLRTSLQHLHLFVEIESTLRNETRFLSLDRPTEALKVFTPRSETLRYRVSDGGQRFVLLTNWRADNNRVMDCPFDKTSTKSWRAVLPARNGVYVEELEVFKSHLVTLERFLGQDRLRVFDRDGKHETPIPDQDASSDIDFEGNVSYLQSFVRFKSESLRRPTTTFDFSFKTQALTGRKILEVPGLDQESYRTEKIWLRARDGTSVPVDLIYKKDLLLDGHAPLWLYGYGAYGDSTQPWFSGSRLSLLDRGWIFAIAHIRGGRELGEEWYEDGRGKKKMNSFYDFIDVAEELVARGYASRQRLYAQGASAGGLLVGAVINLRPDLFHAVVAEVPFVDALTTMLDESIPLTVGEYDEWGNPHHKEHYDMIARYSPYDRLQKGKFPHLLATTGFQDGQVPYWEPAKWAAKIRDLKTNDSMTLLKTDFSSGHVGASGRYETLRDEALVNSFLLTADLTTN